MKSSIWGSRFKKIAALASNFFFCCSVLFPAPAHSAAVSSPSAAAISEARQFVENLKIPSVLGSVQERNLAGPAQIVLIQDAHSQTGAQHSIEKILDYLRRNYGTEGVFLEGAFKGPLPNDLLRLKSGKKMSRKLLERFLDKGLIGGAGIYLAEHEQAMAAYGVEDPELYTHNLKQFRNVYERHEAASRFIKDAEQRIVSLASRSLNTDLQRFFREWLSHLSSRRDTLHYYDFLAEYAKRCLQLDLKDAWNQFEYPQFVRLFKLQSLEKRMGLSHRSKTEADVRRLIKKLEMSGSQTPNEISDLKLFLSDAEQLSGADVRAYFENFYENHQSEGFRFEDYPFLQEHIGKIILSQELDAEKLTLEAETLANRVLEHLSKTEEEKNLVHTFHEIQLLKKLFALELSRQDYSLFKKASSFVLPSELVKTLSLSRDHQGLQLDLLYQSSLEFYETALKRETIMFESVRTLLQSQKIGKCVLIAGGFHTDGLEEQLRRSGISFVSVAPRIGNADSGQSYLDLIVLKNASRLIGSTVPAYGLDRVALAELRKFDARGADYLESLVLQERADFEGAGLAPTGAVLKEAPESSISSPVLKVSMSAEAAKPALHFGHSRSFFRQLVRNVLWTAALMILLMVLPAPLQSGVHSGATPKRSHTAASVVEKPKDKADKPKQASNKHATALIGVAAGLWLSGTLVFMLGLMAAAKIPTPQFKEEAPSADHDPQVSQRPELRTSARIVRAQIRTLLMVALTLLHSIGSIASEVALEIFRVPGSSEIQMNMNVPAEMTPGDFALEGSTDLKSWQVLTNFVLNATNQFQSVPFSIPTDLGYDLMFMRASRQLSSALSAATNYVSVHSQSAGGSAGTNFMNALQKSIDAIAAYDQAVTPPPVKDYVKLAWDPHPQPGINFRIYWGPDEQMTNVLSTGTNLTATVSNLVQNVEYSFTVTAVDPMVGLESLPSNKVKYKILTATRAMAAYPEDFSRGADSLDYWTNRIGNWSIVGGKLMNGTGVNVDSLLAMPHVAPTREFEIKTDFDFLTPSIDQARGLIFSFVDGQNYHYAQYDRSNAKYRVIRVVNGFPSVLAEVNAPGISDNTTHSMKLQRTPTDQLLFYFDEVLVLTLTDAGLGDGKVGIFSGNAAEVHTFDNFMLTEFHTLTAPTVNAPVVNGPASFLTNLNPISLQGTKPANSSVWINGQQVVALDSATSWSVPGYVLSLEGENNLSITAKDAGGTESTPVVVTVTLDQTPPVINVTSGNAVSASSYVLSYTVDGVAKTRAETLVPGNNDLVITEVDGAGNQTVQHFVVNYTPATSTLFSDAFERAAIGSDWQVMVGTWSIVGGQLRHNTVNGGRIVTTQVWSGDYEVKANFEFTAAVTGNKRGIIFGYQDAANFYYGQYSKDTTIKKYRIFKVAGGVTTVIGEAPAPTVADNTYHEIKVRVTGSHAELYFDGVKVVQVDQASAFPSGKAGIASELLGSRVDNFSIVRPELRIVPIMVGDEISRLQLTFRPSVAVAAAAEKTFRPDLRQQIGLAIRANERVLSASRALLEVRVNQGFEAVMQSLFPDRFENWDSALTEEEVFRVMEMTSLTRKDVDQLSRSLLAVPSAAHAKTHAVSIIPVSASLTPDELRGVLRTAVLELKVYRGKAVVLLASSKPDAEDVLWAESQTGGRLVVLGGVSDPFQFASNLFNQNIKIPEVSRRKINAAVRGAYENSYGTGGQAVRQMRQHALVLGHLETFLDEHGSISRVPQQFLLHEAASDAGDLYVAYVRYSIRVSGHVEASEIDEELRENISVHAQIPGRPGITQIAFTDAGLQRVLSFMTAVQAVRQLDRSA